MRIEKIFGATRRATTTDDLLQRAGWVRQHATGIFSYLPLGLRALRRIEAIIREEMDGAGAQEILMPAVQEADAWKATGRYDAIDATLLRFTDRRGHDMVLGMTHEELVAQLAASELQSWREAGIVVYQIQTKFRDEARPRAGLLRTREFLMKDAYSLHLSQEGLEDAYAAQSAAYGRIFRRVGLERTVRVRSATGAMGGSVAHEFMTLLDVGEDTIRLCTACGEGANAEIVAEDERCPCGGPLGSHRAVEVGNIFQLGTRYSEALGAQVDAADGTRTPMVMGSYGIGVSRLLATLVEQHRDERGIRLPPAVAGADAHIIDLLDDGTAAALHSRLQAAGLATILDARDTRASEKLVDADLLGASVQVVAGRTLRESGVLEVRGRWGGERVEVAPEAVVEAVRGLLGR